MSDVATATAQTPYGDAHAPHGDHHGPEHDYHLVDPSPWPLLTSFAALIFVVMVVVTFQNKGGVYTGFDGGTVWTNLHDAKLSAYEDSVAAGSPDFALFDDLIAAGAVEVDGVVNAPAAARWTGEATAIMNNFNAGQNGDAQGAIDKISAIAGAGAVSLEDGKLVANSGSVTQCGFADLSACVLQADGTLERAGFAYGFGLSPFILGLFPLLFCMFMWWRDVVREAHVEGHHKPVVQLGLRYGMLLFIISEIFFFVAFFWAFFANSLFEPWPSEEFKQSLLLAGKNPEGAAFHPLGIPLYNTIILLLSGTTVTAAHEALVANRQTAFKNWLGLTIVLGIIFTGVQIFEYTELPFGFGDFDYGSTFYSATGFHGFHVAIGTIFLAVCWFRARRNHFKADHHFGFEAAAWYWHFVDVVWVFLYVAIYWGLFVTNSSFH